jgi:hypothetical protein
MNRKIIVALTLSAVLGLLIAGCSGLPADVGSMRLGTRWRCAAQRADDPCMACQRASCCAEMGGCVEDADCGPMLLCTAQRGTVCGNGTPEGVTKLLSEMACWDAHCADKCPKIHGGST